MCQLEAARLKADLLENGCKVVEMVKQTKYDLILMDVQMAKLNGIEAKLLQVS